jgi:hypothetical protein
MSYEVVQLANGTFSVRSNAEAETFHPVVGPVDEALTLYVNQLDLRRRVASVGREFVIWDVGLGAAGNVLTAVNALDGTPAHLRILSFDHTLEPLKVAVKHGAELKYPSGYSNELERLITKGAVEFTRGECRVNWSVNVGDFPTLLNGAFADRWPKPDAIFFDAYSPAKNPAMWTLPLFQKIFSLLDPKRPCAMPTYSRSTMLRVTLLLAGFYVGVGRPIAEKDETTIAANDLSIIEKPLGRDWLKRARNSTCAEPLREPVYTRAPLSEETWAELQKHPQFNT